MSGRTNEARRQGGRVWLEVQAMEDRALPSAPFAQAVDASGLASDPAGDVFLTGLETTSQGTSSIIEELSPQGDLLRKAVISTDIIVYPGSLAVLSTSAPRLGSSLAAGDVLDLMPNGLILAYRPSTGTLTPFLNLATLPSVDASAAYDVAAGRARDLSGLISLPAAGFNALAVRDNEILVTGICEGLDFVLRLQYGPEDVLSSARVLVASSAVEQGNWNAPGVAVNASGLALTTLPVPLTPNSGNGTMVPIGFGPDFDQGRGPMPFVATTNRVASEGITTDSLGNFVIAVGPGQSPLTGSTPGLVTATAALTRFTSLPVSGTPSTGTRAVAIGPWNDCVYSAFPSLNQVWRTPYTPQRAVIDDFNGDGRADLVLFRPPTAEWWFAGRGVVQFGMPGDIPAPADYDGDGKTDLAVFRPSTGQWFLAGVGVIQFGMPGDIPVPADYDGDGRADPAVFRPGTGQWFIMGSRTGRILIPFGAPGDIPAPGDYDGDGKVDLAVYRPSTAQWFILGSRVGPMMMAFGTPGLDIPVPADYHGDGHDDLAVYQPSTATWYIQNLGALAFGQPYADLAVPADYTGTGRASVATYRPSIAQWFVAGLGAIPFGQPNVVRPARLPTAYLALGLGRSPAPDVGRSAGLALSTTQTRGDRARVSSLAIVPLPPSDDSPLPGRRSARRAP